MFLTFNVAHPPVPLLVNTPPNQLDTHTSVTTESLGIHGICDLGDGPQLKSVFIPNNVFTSFETLSQVMSVHN